MTTQATEEYLSVGVTTASAGGMPSSLASFLGLMSRLNQLPLRVALFPLFEEVGEGLLSGEVALNDFAQARVSVPRVKIIADGSIQGYTGYLKEPYTSRSRETVLIAVILSSPRGTFWQVAVCMSAASLSLFIAMATPRSMTVWMR